LVLQKLKGAKNIVGSKGPKDAKGTKGPKDVKGTKEPKDVKGTKEPKVDKGPKVSGWGCLMAHAQYPFLSYLIHLLFD